MQWHTTIYPRIRCFLPAGTIVEIAPGRGRWTRFLLDHCERYIGIDLSRECITFCRERFGHIAHAEFHVNDGRSLAMVPPGEADFVFSFDSLVHAEPDVISDYVAELAEKLAPQGVAFLHHSNLGAHRKLSVNNRYTQKLLNYLPGDRSALARFIQLDRGWRTRTMTAARFADMCGASGLHCVGQEIVNWDGPELIDCMSALARPGSKWDRPNVVVENPRFIDGVKSAHTAQQAFGSLGSEGEG